MGGKAFIYERLNCNRIPPSVYEKIKQQALVALRTVFLKACVPSEMPGKVDHGDVDFFVAQPLESSSIYTFDRFDWNKSITSIKSALNTTYGKRGRKNPDCIYFAIPHPTDGEHWIQLDVKVCFFPALFEWQAFLLKYASVSKVLGSMLKPLGLTIAPEGLSIRVEEVENDNKNRGDLQSGTTTIWLSNNPKDLLKIMRLDKRLLQDSFKTPEEIYKYLTNSWLFSSEHFAERQKDTDFIKQLDGHTHHWRTFIMEWIPRQDFDVREIGSDHHVYQKDLQTWYEQHRAAVREQVFLLFPQAAAEYYTKIAEQNKKREEQRLQKMLISAINSVKDDWNDEICHPRIMIKPGFDNFSGKDEHSQFTPSETRMEGSGPTEANEPWHIPLYHEPLKQKPPTQWKRNYPSSVMSDKARLQCLYRWTSFDPVDGKPYLQPTRREKSFVMQWSDATEAGATDDELIGYAKSMWWHIWLRQSFTNYIGRWKQKFEKDRTIANAIVRAKNKGLAALQDRPIRDREKVDTDKILETPAAVDLGIE